MTRFVGGGSERKRAQGLGPGGGPVEVAGLQLDSTSSHGVQLRFLTTKEAGPFLGLSPRTLEKHRVSGTGPVYRKLGGRVVYAMADLLAWADLGVRQSTSERPITSIKPASNRRAMR